MASPEPTSAGRAKASPGLLSGGEEPGTVGAEGQMLVDRRLESGEFAGNLGPGSRISRQAQPISASPPRAETYLGTGRGARFPAPPPPYLPISVPVLGGRAPPYAPAYPPSVIPQPFLYHQPVYPPPMYGQPHGAPPIHAYPFIDPVTRLPIVMQPDGTSAPAPPPASASTLPTTPAPTSPSPAALGTASPPVVMAPKKSSAFTIIDPNTGKPIDMSKLRRPAEHRDEKPATVATQSQLPPLDKGSTTVASAVPILPKREETSSAGLPKSTAPLSTSVSTLGPESRDSPVPSDQLDTSQFSEPQSQPATSTLPPCAPEPAMSSSSAPPESNPPATRDLSCESEKSGAEKSGAEESGAPEQSPDSKVPVKGDSSGTTSDQQPIPVDSESPTPPLTDRRARDPLMAESHASMSLTVPAVESPASASSSAPAAGPDQSDDSESESRERLETARSVEEVDDWESLDEAALVQKVASSIRYESDSWRPDRPDGRKMYSKEFLIQFQQLFRSPPSGFKPVADIAQQSDLGSPRNFRDPRPGGGRSRGGPPATVPLKRPTAPVDEKGWRQKKDGQPPPPPPKSSLSRSKKAHKGLEPTAGRWERPSVGASVGDAKAALQRDTQRLLNKLTMDNFGKLLPKFLALNVSEREFLEQVIDCLFTKAIDEPNFQSLYTILCVELANAQKSRLAQSLPAGQLPPQDLDFRRALVARCQVAFEQRQRPPRLPADPSTLRPEEREAIELAQVKVRARNLGNIKFIGALFKKGMIQSKIIHKILTKFLHGQDLQDGGDLQKLPAEEREDVEEDLEHFTKLITIVGKRLQQEAVSGGPEVKHLFDAYFSRIRVLIQRVDLPSRLRFGLQELLDLRARGWKNRSGKDVDADRPKTVEEARADIIREKEREKERALRKGKAPVVVDQEFSAMRIARRPEPTRGDGWKEVPGGAPSKRGAVREAAPPSPSFGRGSTRKEGKDLTGPPAADAANRYKLLSSSGDQEKPVEVAPIATKPAVSVERQLNRLLDEYLDSWEDEAAIESWKELAPETSLIDSFLDRMLSVAVDSGDKDQPRRLVATLLRKMVGEQLVHSESLHRALSRYIDSLADVVLDVPRAPELLGTLVGLLSTSPALISLSALVDLTQSLTFGDRLLSSCLKFLLIDHRSDALSVWHSIQKKLHLWTALDPSAFLQKHSHIADLAAPVPPLLRETETQPSVSLPSNPSEELNAALRRYLSSTASTAQELEDEAGYRLSQLFPVLGEVLLGILEPLGETERLQAISPLSSKLLKFLSTDQHQLQLLHSLQSAWSSVPRPKGLLMSCFSTLYRAKIVTKESISAWTSRPADTPRKEEGLFEVSPWLRTIIQEEKEAARAAKKAAQIVQAKKQ